MTGPLEGVRVLDLTSVVMGPLATQTLGDLGAEVIAIEAAKGETNRYMGSGPHPQLSGIALNLLRNKRNVAIDLKHPDGRDAVLRIAATCDVVVTNLRPAPLARLRLTYDDVVVVRPDVVYCQAQGFPSDSGRADDPAYDDVVQAAGGVPDLLHRAGGARALFPSIIADKISGLTMTYALVAALFERERSGRGQHLELPMVDALSAFLLVEHGAGAVPQPATSERAGYERILTPHRRPQATADGWISIFPYTNAHFVALIEATGREDLRDDRLMTQKGRAAHPELLYGLLGSIIATKTTEEWLSLCRTVGIPAAEVADLDAMVGALPDAEHPLAGRYKAIPPPVRFSRTPASATRRPAPTIGQHNREVLVEVGLSEADVDALEAAGVLRTDRV
ncbi:MAG TPA: CoA transferase [Acidimicrobiales bacterium]|nr:CoA transferase [Acidimicrobiales bacterium]